MWRANRVVVQCLDNHTRKECFGNREPSRLFPVQMTEALSHLMAMWNAAAVDDFPFIGIPLAGHTGRIGAWPFTPQQAHILVILSQVFAGRTAGRGADDMGLRHGLSSSGAPSAVGSREHDETDAQATPATDDETDVTAQPETREQSPGGDQP